MFPVIDELSPLSPLEAHCLITPVGLVGWMLQHCRAHWQTHWLLLMYTSICLSRPTFLFCWRYMSVIIHKVLQTHAGLCETLRKTK